MRADARANRGAIVDAARRLYAGRGGDVPFSAVAQEAGVGIATLYRHFPTQQDLVAGVVEHIRDEVVGICDRWLPELETDPERAWSSFATELAALRLAAVVPNLLPDPPTLAPDLVGLRAQALAAGTRVLDAAKRLRLVRDEVRAEQFLLGLGVIARPLPDAAPLVPGLGDWLVGVYLRGLRPESPEGTLR